MSNNITVTTTSETNRSTIEPFSYTFTASKLGGRVRVVRTDKNKVVPMKLLRFDPSTGKYSEVASNVTEIDYNYTMSSTGVNSSSKFKITHETGTQGDDYIELSLGYSASKEEKVLENYEEQVTVSVDVTSFEPKTQTIYNVNKSTNTTTKEEVIVDTTVEEKTTSITKSLFNPKPVALMRMDQLFNLPGRINSPTIDLLSYIQDDINS